MRLTVLSLAVAAALASGCARKAPPEPGPTTRLSPDAAVSVTEGGATFVYREVQPDEQVAATDDLRAVVDVVVITAPVGIISGSREFWAMTRTLNDTTQDSRLRANGIHVGVMRAQDWAEARAALGSGPSTTSQPVKLSGTARASLPAGDFMHRTIFYFDAKGEMHGRTYDESELSWGMHFAPDPARPGRVQLDVVPVVQSQRRQMRLTRSGQDVGIDYVQPEVAYDLGIHASVPVGSAIAIAPTPEGLVWETSIARAFLTEDSPGIRNERLLMLYPRLFRMDKEKPSRENDLARREDERARQEKEERARQKEEQRVKRQEEERAKQDKERAKQDEKRARREQERLEREAERAKREADRAARDAERAAREQGESNPDPAP